ncbi:hypothetical protein CspHIS471_0504820 [Cutaneotrichosporon sp. HIS471]|nr:hypothetical protein CspHIS471_0504820 [Cutaneotrichosporon sp. HIS471]
MEVMWRLLGAGDLASAAHAGQVLLALPGKTLPTSECDISTGGLYMIVVIKEVDINYQNHIAALVSTANKKLGDVIDGKSGAQAGYDRALNSNWLRGYLRMTRVLLRRGPNHTHKNVKAVNSGMAALRKEVGVGASQDTR